MVFYSLDFTAYSGVLQIKLHCILLGFTVSTLQHFVFYVKEYIMIKLFYTVNKYKNHNVYVAIYKCLLYSNTFYILS